MRNEGGEGPGQGSEVPCYQAECMEGVQGNSSFLLEESDSTTPAQPRASWDTALIDLALVHLRIGVSNLLGITDA